MPDIDLQSRVDPTDLGDDDIRAIEDPALRDALYRVTEKIRRVIEYHESLITTLYDAVSDIEDSI